MSPYPDDLVEHIRLSLEPCAEGDPVRSSTVRLMSSNLAFLIRHKFNPYIKADEVSILVHSTGRQECITIAKVDTSCNAVHGHGEDRKKLGILFNVYSMTLRKALDNLDRESRNMVRKLVNKQEAVDRKKEQDKKKAKDLEKAKAKEQGKEKTEKHPSKKRKLRTPPGRSLSLSIVVSSSSDDHSDE